MIDKSAISQAVVQLAIAADIIDADEVGYENAEAGSATSTGLNVSAIIYPIADAATGRTKQMSDWFIQFRIDCLKGTGTAAGRTLLESLATGLQGKRGTVSGERFSVYRTTEVPGGELTNGSYRLYLNVYLNGIN